ncbi:MAG: VanW family protein [Candidatus Yanofskybacteria bacterium]|nr:VanW family protein [Candidatus Yanofskybacteria bacterium]
MGPYWRKIMISLLAAVVLASVFMLGQIFYYSKSIRSTTGGAPVLTSGKLSANLSAALQQKKIILKSQEKDIPVGSGEFKGWFESYNRNYTGKEELRINTKRVSAYLEKISKEIDIPPVNAKLVIDNGKVNEFRPPKQGRTLNAPASIVKISVALASGSNDSGNSDKTLGIELAVDEKWPEVTLDKINELGISTLLARGESDFSGSPKFRVHNIATGSEKFTGILLKPGEEFSFNKFLGSVDASSGYLPELVIKNGTLIPEYGGGLCQVSTTLFRAAALAGLPILERHPHSIPVRYYNPQGFDATIYPGVSDLRFKNDTPAYVLIQSKIANSKIYFEIYGTDDGRKTTLEGPRQYDIKSNGALKAELKRIVIYPDGAEKKDVFQSSYKAPGSFQVVRNPLE